MFKFNQKRTADIKMLGIAVIFLETRKKKCVMKEKWLLLADFMNLENKPGINHILQTAQFLFLL